MRALLASLLASLGVRLLRGVLFQVSVLDPLVRGSSAALLVRCRIVSAATPAPQAA